MPSLPVFTGTGFYAGVNAGHAFPTGSGGFTDPTYGTVTGGGRSGGFAGGQIGYNYQSMPGSGVGGGVETDIQGTAFAKADAAYLGSTPYYGVRPSLDSFGTVRARLGHAFDRVLVYGTCGFACGGGARSICAGSYSYALPSTDRTVYAAGGIEYAFTEKLSAKVEALYLHLGRGTNAATYYNASVPAFYGAGKQQSVLRRLGLV
ncbi:porin family protein [Methylobacterium oryzae]|uniref:outer membrane protein n=1 Tax=Methylobacterium oryzae TaxID=334852 RepID=UPI002F35A413